MIQINSLRFFFGGGANHCGSCCYNNGQYNGYNNGYNNGQYNNGQYNNGYNNGQYNNGQYNNGNYNNGFSSGFTNGGLYADCRNNIIIIITFSAIIVFIIDSVFEISANHIVPMKNSEISLILCPTTITWQSAAKSQNVLVFMKESSIPQAIINQRCLPMWSSDFS